MKTFNDVDILPDKNLQRKYCKIYRYLATLNENAALTNSALVQCEKREKDITLPSLIQWQIRIPKGRNYLHI